MSHLFISYRRSDSQDVVGRIYDRLTAAFQRHRVFKDVDSIPIGIPFPDFLRSQHLGIIGLSGSGKTHLATALAVCACHQGRRVRFTTLAALANELQEADSRRSSAG